MLTTTISPSSTRAPGKVATPKPRAGTAAPMKKRRVIRRRGRARGEPDSDDEIEREAATDSESEDDPSSLDSADDSDIEPASIEVVIAHDRAHLPTPRNSKSPDSATKDTTKMNGGAASFFSSAGDWSEMVTDEKDNGPADLPVIEFADFKGHPAPQTRKSKKANKPKRQSESRATPVQPTLEDAKSSGEIKSPVAEQQTTPSHPPRTSGQSARQAYQHKLETDPSFVPTIGNFWGHDDRLIDTELRSLSGWWRGRGRGRGRGFAMRGRGGFQGPQSRVGAGGEEAPPPKDLRPIERAWTHDGFEDMKRKEEQRRAEQLAARNDQSSPKRGAFSGGRGGFIPGRGRGGFGRGGFASPTRPSFFAQPGKVRFLMKPEFTWTKQHEAFLYFDPALKPRAGQGPGFRVKLPGKQPQVVRAPSKARSATPQASTSKVTQEGSDAGDRHFVIRLPQRAGKKRELGAEKKAEITPIEEVFTVRPQLATAKPRDVSESIRASVTVVEAVVLPASDPVQALLEPTIRSQLEQLTLEPQPSDPQRLAKTEQAVLRQPTKDVTADARVAEESASASRPALAPLQTVFSPLPPPPQPIAQPSPAYGSPYGYHPALPPGLAMDQHGIPYELATGRPVYLQPPAMYNPRPMMPSHFTPGMTFVPGHMHHPSAVSPDFLSQTSSQTPPMNGFIDPATGTPIFSFPRQTSRIEIRAPTEESDRSAKSARTPSGLRTAAPSFQPSRSAGNSDGGYYQHSGSSESGAPPYENMNGHGSMEDANMAGMMYQPYQQTYYYPEPYGYPPYVDMSQGGQYDMYNVDQAPQGTVYY